MDPDRFEAAVRAGETPRDLPPALRVLWLDARGEWDAAHDIAQAMSDRTGSLLHAYLHRKEGDLANAGYWYRRAGVGVPDCDLDQEWRRLVDQLDPCGGVT